VALEAQAIQAQQVALAAQAQRMTGLLDGGFIAANEVDLRTAESSSQAAKLEAERATLIDTQLSVNDCVMRAPFEGDVGDRWLDPGAFVHPGEPIVSIVDRRIVRLVVDVPEDDFDAVAPGAEGTIHLVAVSRDLKARVSRRSPSADPTTRTVHIEIDLPDPLAQLPVNTTAELWMGVGNPVPATRLPLVAADLTQDHAKVFEVEDGKAHVLTAPVLGEAGGDLFLSREKLAPDTRVVLEGRMNLNDGDTVTAKERPAPLADSGANAHGDAAALPSAQ
jgi:RND family efflux transporter MFP subunit